MATIHQAQVNFDNGFSHLEVFETMLGYTSLTIKDEEDQTLNKATIYLNAQQWAELAVAAQQIADAAAVRGVGNFDGCEVLLNQDVLDRQAGMATAAQVIPALAETV